MWRDLWRRILYPEHDAATCEGHVAAEKRITRVYFSFSCCSIPVTTPVGTRIFSRPPRVTHILTFLLVYVYVWICSLIFEVPSFLLPFSSLSLSLPSLSVYTLSSHILRYLVICPRRFLRVQNALTRFSCNINRLFHSDNFASWLWKLFIITNEIIQIFFELTSRIVESSASEKRFQGGINLRVFFFVVEGPNFSIDDGPVLFMTFLSHWGSLVSWYVVIIDIVRSNGTIIANLINLLIYKTVRISC